MTDGFYAISEDIRRCHRKSNKRQTVYLWTAPSPTLPVVVPTTAATTFIWQVLWYAVSSANPGQVSPCIKKQRDINISARQRLIIIDT